MNQDDRRRKAYKQIAIGLVAVYLFLDLYILHAEVYKYSYPHSGLGEIFSGGLSHMFLHPFSVFPIPPGAGSIILGLTVFITICAGLIVLDEKIRAHDNPDTVQGDAKWLKNLTEYNKKFTEPFGSPDNSGKNNMILSQDIFMSMDNKAIRRNMNVFVIGGSGAGKSFNFVGPNIMQANCSYICTDPSGGLFKEYGRFLEYQGYRIKCFNINHMDKGSHYNPFNYIHSDKDIEVLVTTLISNTTPPDKQGGDPFWEKSETALLVALIAYLYHYTTKNCQNFSNVMRLMRAADINENDSSARSPLDCIFEEVEKYDPESFAVKQYKTFKMGAGKTLKGILISCAVRLQAFDLEDVANLTDTDDIDLDSIGDEKTALFILLPTGEKTFNFLASLMYSQLFQRMYDYCENTAEFSQLILDGDKQLVKTFRAGDPEESARMHEEAKAFLERAKRGRIHHNNKYKWYELRTEAGELVTYRGTKEDIIAARELIRQGEVLPNAEQSNHGQRLPIHTRMMLDEFANIGKIPEFDQKVATIRKYEISVSIILQSLAQMKKMYKDDWSDITGNCDTTIYLGGGADTETTKWVSELLGKETRVVMNVSFAKTGGSTSMNRQGVELFTPAQLRTMDENDCIVIEKSLDAFKGKKYMALKHPNRQLVESMDPYFFEEDKLHYLQGASPEGEEEETPEDVHREVEEVAEEEADARDEAEEEKEQAAEEAMDNEDAEGDKLIGSPQEINDPAANFDAKIAEEGVSNGSGVTASQDMSERMDSLVGVSEENWGLDEITFGSNEADDFTS